MAGYEPFQLPNQYGGERIVTRQDLGRLTIAGCLDLSTWCSNGQWRWPTPLILLDGEEAAPRMQIHEAVRRHFYGPMLDRRVGVWTLNSTEWAFGVDIPSDGTRPSSYLGHGIDPSNAAADIFNEPIPYDQEAFDDKASQFFRDLVANSSERR